MSKKEKYTNATVFYNCSGEQRTVFCTNYTLTKTLNKLNKCSWITDIEVIYYDFSEIDTLTSNLKSEATIKEHNKISGNINAMKTDRGLVFNNIWNRDLMPKCNRISSIENFTDLMEFNKSYSMDDLLKLAQDSNMNEDYIIEPIQYLRAAV